MATKKRDKAAFARTVVRLRRALARAEKIGATPSGVAMARVEMFRTAGKYLALETARAEVEAAEQARADAQIARWEVV